MLYSIGYSYPYLISSGRYGETEVKIFAEAIRYGRLVTYWTNKLKHTQKKNRKEIRTKIIKYTKLKLNLRTMHPEEFI